jgi:molybdopterin biosynthesis enzyme
MIAPDESLRLVLNAARRLPAEERSTFEAFDRVLAEPVAPDRDQPLSDRAMMDSYAVPVDAAGKHLHVVYQLAAGCAATVHLTVGQCMEIMTGAPFPPAPGQHIAPRGS